MNRALRQAPLHLCATIVCIICAGPILFIVLSSFRDLSVYGNAALSLRAWTLSNYNALLSTSSFPRWILNSLIVSGSVTLLTVVIDLMAGFAFAKIRFRGREIMFLVLISTMMLPFSITLVPTYLLVAQYGLVNTYPGLILPLLSGPIGVYLLRQFIRGVPDALLESARIDGASTPRIFLNIVAPLCLQPAAVLAIFTFVASWNNFLWPLLIAQTDSMRTITVGIATTNGQFSTNLGSETAGIVLSLAPMLVLFLVFQRWFLQGIAAGALKG